MYIVDFRRLLARGLYYLLRKNTSAAKLLGVKFGSGCKFIGDPVEMFGSEPWAISIGNHVELTNGVQIITHDGALWVARQLDKDLEKADVVQKVKIGNNVFVGTNSIILGGVTIGDNVIIGASSVVNRDIPSNSVAVGSPCRSIKTIDSYIESIKGRGATLNTKGMSSKQKRQIWEEVL